MKLKCLLMFICLSIGTLSSAQSDVRVGWKLGYEYQKSSYVETGLLIYSPLTALNFNGGFYGADIGYTCRVGGHKFVSGPKLTFEMHAFIFGGRIGFTYLTDYEQGAFQFAPEIGLSFFGRIYLFFGYNWTTSNRDFWDATGPKISFGLNPFSLKDFR